MEPLGDVGGGPANEPQDAPGFVRRAREREARGDLAGAVADCTQALQRDPQFADAFLTRGALRQKQGYIDRALADFERAAQALPGDPRPHLLRGQLHLAQDQLDLAREDYDRALEVDPRNAEAYTARAQLRAARDDAAGAVADCDKALEVDPRNVDALLTRAAAFWEQGELARGRADCDEAIRLAPDNARAYLLRGNIREDQEDDEGAEADFREAVRRDASLAEGLRDRGYELEDPGPQLPVPAGAPDVSEVLPPLEEEERPAAQGGGRTWIYVATVHGALAGAVWGLINGTGFATALGLLLFTPLFLVVFLGRQAGGRQAALGGLVLGAGAFIGLLAGGKRFSDPLIDPTRDKDYLRMTFWVLGWGVCGGILMLFAGASHVNAIVGHVQGGFGRAFSRARTGAVTGFVVGALLCLAYWFLPGVLAGILVGFVAGVILGGAAGNDRWFLPLVVLGTALGGVAGAGDATPVFQVVGAGVASALYWGIAGGLVGVLAGASVGSRAASRIVAGPFFSRLFGKNPLAEMFGQAGLPPVRGLNLGVGLMAAGCGLFLGASVGLVTGSVFGGVAYAPRAFPDLAADDLVGWLITGAVIGILVSGFFASRVAPYESPYLTGSSVSLASSPRGLPLVFVGLAGAALGAGIAALAWVGHLPLGSFLYWVLVGAGTGAVVGTKLWTIMEK